MISEIVWVFYQKYRIQTDHQVLIQVDFDNSS